MELKEKVLVNETDNELQFNDLTKAKEHFLTVASCCMNFFCTDCKSPYEECLSLGIKSWGCKFVKVWEICKKDILHAWSLEELACVLNYYSDTFFNASHFIVKSI